MKPLHVFLSPFLLLSAFASAATVLGTNLNIGTSNSTPGNHTAAIGYNNLASQPHSLVAGIHNYVYDGDNEHSSFAAGQYNTLLGACSIISGSFNQANEHSSLTIGYYNYNDAANSIVGGQSHILQANRHENALVGGMYSAVLSKPAHLVIGNGSSPSLRSNSFIVHADGDIVIPKPQGDISMGIYDD